MISGFNTDVEFNGIVYHVQTEDKGLETPLILSLVYTGGQILASKRTPYEDLLADGFDENKLSERLNRQHKLICAAIKTGRLEDLKRMSQNELAQKRSRARPPATLSGNGVPEKITGPESHPVPPLPEMPATATETTSGKGLADVLPDLLGRSKSTKSVKPAPRVPSPARGPAALKFFEPPAVNALRLSLVGEKKLLAGTVIELRVRVERSTLTGLCSQSGVPVTVSLMGSSFKPLTYTSQTGANGEASLILALPHFTTGRAIVLIKATDGHSATELRRIIQQSD